ncbi:MAG: type II toxin-antitoxin system prevent-host-death family antitoxin [Armatimonadetes bacterium]|nr:type II toxin-antitoxin system prevent-host-death family antitoxin [Armatimonadota bacterium]MBS1725405.1 type II toxin-antitoxin system prevent-host-death family antitoxin [Armatimonadota bacterium]
MKPITYSELRANLAKSMDMVCENHEPLVVTRQKADPVVLISLEDYRSMEETYYLMRSPKNAARLARSIESIEKGEGIIVEL